MPDPTEQVTEDVANRAVETTKQVITSLIERIYDTQRQMGVWEAEENDPDSEDLGSFLLHIHSKVSAAYQIHLSGDVESPEPVTISDVLLETCLDLLGAVRRFDKSSGAKFIQMVIEQAREAQELQKAEVESLGEFEAEGLDDSAGEE